MKKLCVYLFSISIFSISIQCFSQVNSLVQPLDGEYLSSANVQLKWNSSSTAAYYNIQIASDSLFSIIAKQANFVAGDNYLVGSGLTLGNRYFWRVIAHNIAGDSVYSNIRKFTVFTPINVPHLQVWLKSDTNFVLNGASVQQWNDNSGNNNNGVQVSALNQPQLNPNQLNSYPSVQFLGTNYLDIDTVDSLDTDVLDVFSVVRINGDLSGLSIISSSSYASGAETGSSSLWQLFSLAGGYYFQLRASTDAQSGPYVSLTSNNNFNFINCKWKADNTIALYKNGVSSGFSASTASAAPLGHQYTRIGASSSSLGSFFNGDICEYLIFNKDISAGETNSINSYLRYKYSPPINLGYDINVMYGFCDTIISAGSNFIKYQWSTGNNDTLPAVTVTNPGKYWVDVQDIFGFWSSDTIMVEFPSYNKISPANIICAGDSLKWDLQLSKQDYTFEWQNATSDSLIYMDQPGMYHVKILDSLGCFIYSDTVSVSVDTFANIATLGNDTNFCSGNSISLKQGASQAVDYIWSDASTVSSILIQTSGQYILTVSDINNCEKVDTINVSIIGIAPLSSFTTGLSCKNDSSKFTDQSIPPGSAVINQWQWDFGDASANSSVQNPMHLFPDTGIYNVKLSVTTDVGCSKDTTMQVHVYPKPVINFVSTLACDSGSTSFIDATAFKGYGSGAVWNWNFGDPLSGARNISGLQNPVHQFNIPGNYSIKLKVSNNQSCVDSVTQNITVFPSPVASFSNTTACEGAGVQFTDNSAVSGPYTISTRKWSFGDNTFSTATNPTKTYPVAAGYQVKLVATSNNGCKDSLQTLLNVNFKPSIQFSVNGSSCVDNVTSFVDASSVSGSTISGWKWTFDGTTTSLLQNPGHIFTVAGNHLVKLVSTSAAGCFDSLSTNITVNPLPVPSFTFSPAYGNKPLPVNISNSSTGASSYSWDFGDGSPPSTNTSPNYTYSDTGMYNIKLIAISSSGCRDSVSQTVKVYNRYIDLAVLGVTPVVQNNYLSVSAALGNIGFTDVSSFDIYAQANGIGVFKETFSGNFMISTSQNYIFKTSVFLSDNNPEPFVCVIVNNINGSNDDNAVNNELCDAVNTAEFVVLDPYPNPGAGSMITIPVIIPEEDGLLIDLYDDKGAFIGNIFDGVIPKGLQFVGVNTANLRSAMYAVKINYKSETVIKKIQKL